MKVKLWVALCNGGDGSVIPRFFNTQREAINELEEDTERYCDDIQLVVLDIDHNGELTTKYSDK